MYLDLLQLEDDLDRMLYDFGYQVVNLQSAGFRSRRSFRVFIDRVDGAPVTIDDCAAVSSQVRLYLEKAGAYDADSSLEVSSGGLDRVLKRNRDFERYLGAEIAVTVNDGQKKRTVTGELSSFTDEVLVLSSFVAGGEKASQAIQRSQVTMARLVPHLEF